MASNLKFDELNSLFTEYYDIMNISNEQKLERIELAEELFDVFLFLFTYIDAQISASVSVEIDKDSIYEMFERRYNETLENYGIDLSKHPDLEKHISKVSHEMVDSTFDGKETKKNTIKNKGNAIQDTIENSLLANETQNPIYDRAITVAENESNSVFNRVEYDVAVSSNKYTKKTWLTENDDKVRPTHRDVDSLTIPIDDYFLVGDSYMLFPRDDVTDGVSPREVIGCRCAVMYK